MKAAIVFYSFSGNTRRMCLFLKDKFEEKKHSAEVVEIKPVKEASFFFHQGFQAVAKRMPAITDVDSDLKKYDFIIFASPVWVVTFAPALRSYLSKIGPLENKKTACFLTCGSGAGSNRALGELENILREKRAHILFSKNLAGRKSKDKNFLENNFKTLLEIIEE